MAARARSVHWPGSSSPGPQAASYRKGRVLLAGDAAHIHLPAGGPGISTGLQDAANLGWRLAAVLGGHQPEALLDGNDEERHAAGARVLQHTQAQAALMAPQPHTPALRGLLGELFQVPEARRFIARRVQAVDTRYGVDPNPLVGAWMPFRVDLRRNRFVLLTPSPSELRNHWGERLEVRGAEQWMFIRPDGHVAWAGDGDPRDALNRWLGRSARSGVVPGPSPVGTVSSASQRVPQT